MKGGLWKFGTNDSELKRQRTQFVTTRVLFVGLQAVNAETGGGQS